MVKLPVLCVTSVLSALVTLQVEGAAVSSDGNAVSKLSRRAPGEDCPMPADLRETAYRNTNGKMVEANGGNEYFALTRPVKESYNVVIIWDLEKALKNCDTKKEIPRKKDWPIYVPFCYKYSRPADALKRYERLLRDDLLKFDNDSSGRMYACLLYYIKIGEKGFNIDVDHKVDVRFTANRLALEEEERQMKEQAFRQASTDEAKAALGLGMTVSSVKESIGSIMAPTSPCIVPKELDLFVQVPSATFYMDREMYEVILEKMFNCIEKYGPNAIDKMEWPLNTGHCITEAVKDKKELKFQEVSKEYLICVRKLMKRDWEIDDNYEDESPVLTRSRSSAMFKYDTKSKSNSLNKSPEGGTTIVKNLNKGEALVVEKGSMMDVVGKSSKGRPYPFDQEWMDVDGYMTIADMQKMKNN